MARFKISIAPNCTGAMPSCVATGSRMGVKIKMRGPMSMMQPRTRHMMLMSSRMTTRLSEIPSSALVTMAGTFK